MICISKPFTLSPKKIFSQINKLFIHTKFDLHTGNNLYSELWSIWPFVEKLQRLIYIQRDTIYRCTILHSYFCTQVQDSNKVNN